ncbi:MAG: STAS domain-containing protein [Rhodoferax sp.]|nr:STAS domain-containing protein [Rhodoferax sp.]
MLKDDNGGLLSKVVKFVRNPTTNWADLDHQETDRESAYSKQALKEMIERKRRNDFVRKREFDMLRKIRRRESLVGHDFAARPSFFQSSIPSKPDDRASTLKKIDEIEAQMSMQWWKTKSGNSSSHGASVSGADSTRNNSVSPTLSPAARAAHYAVTDPAPLAVTNNTEPTLPSPLAADFVMSPGGAKENTVNGFDGFDGFGGADPLAVETQAFAHDPELEEASIRFANGDDAGAEAGLLEALGPQGTRGKHEETWMTLFDLYRAIGAKDRFESAAIDFAGQFERSAPAWFSMPDRVGHMTAPVVPARSAARAANWTSPASVGVQTVAALNAALATAPSPWRLDWTRLASVEEAAVAPLRQLFAFWSAQPVQLQFIGAHQLDDVLKKATPQGDKSVSQELWRLRMEVLRLMNQVDEFELVALTYCVTYEVSPPSWEQARCDYKALDADGSESAAHAIIGEVTQEAPVSTLPGELDSELTASQPGQSRTRKVALAGQITGDVATGVLDELDGKLSGADVMVISCDKLIRVDFSAAGTLLNWASAQHAQGHLAQFNDVHRLVAAFFSVIGIDEVARVIPRAD